MDDMRNPLVRLQDLQHFVATGTLEDSLQEQAVMTRGLLNAETISIMLLGDDEAPRLRVYARDGTLPDAALVSSLGYGEGIAGRVLENGIALLVPDIGKSVLAGLARRDCSVGASLMCAPVRIDGKIVGVINVAGACGQIFDDTGLQLLEVIALFIGKSIQVQQLQRLLDSRFAQFALQQETSGAARTEYRNPDEIARILAKTFYKEMTKAGFAPAQIIQASSEIIDQLHYHLKKEI